MDAAYYQEEFRKERRARLAAERLLEQKQSQLKDANRKLSQHAIYLSGQIVDQRKVLDKLKGENSAATAQSLKASHKALAAERLLWDAVKSIQDGFALYDKERKLIAANAPYLALFESSQNVGPGISMESILELCLEGDLVDRGGRSEDEWYDFMLDRLNEENIQPITLKLCNGTYIKLLDRRTADGGIVSLALNITDTIRREEELKKARDKAMSADHAKSAFLAKMSHEFRTPINGIVGMAELLQDQVNEDEIKLYANTIKSSGLSLLGFVNNVLEYATIEAETPELNIEPFKVTDVVEAVKNGQSVGEIAQDVQVYFDQDPDIPTDLLGDVGRIGQIVENLFSNAVQNTQSGHIIVRAMWQQTDDQSHLIFAVEDTGVGIAEDKLEHIFGGFNQAEDSHSRNQDGAGLGLSIVQKLVDAMDGEMSILSTEGIGSQFQVSLPIACSESASHTSKQSPIDGNALVVSPDPFVHASIARALDMCGIEFDEAEQIPNVMDEDISLVFMDRKFAGEIKISGKKLIEIGDGSNQLTAPYRSEDVLKFATLDHVIPETSSVTKEPLTTLRVLAAEDNKTNQLVFSKMVKDANIELTMVADGKEAVDAYKAFDPHLVFMDISMPKMDGMEATQQIRWHEAETGLEPVTIVAMTAHAMEGDEARIKNCGLDHYLTKPLNKAAILEMIANVSTAMGVIEPQREAG